MSRLVLRKAKTALRTAAFLVSNRALMRANRQFRDRHLGERVFILCNGPSVLQQDLRPLRDEVVMSVSSGYLHKDFPAIRPRYHFVPPVTYGVLQEADVLRWFEEMDRRIGDAQLLLGTSEHALVQTHALFKGRRVNYLCAALPFWPASEKVIDICGPIPRVASVPIMCLIVALYMGFRDIYLVGTDHDSFATRRYKYAFEPTVLRGKDRGVGEDGTIHMPLYDELKANLLLWTQYRRVKRIALANARGIYNATAGGMLDEFPRVELGSLLNSRSVDAAAEHRL